MDRPPTRASALLFACVASCTLPLLAHADATTRYEVRPFLSGPPLVHAAGIAVDAEGKLYVGDYGNATIFKVDIASKAVSTLVEGSPLREPLRMLIGDGRAATGFDLIVSDENAGPPGPCCNGSVWRVDRRTGALSLLVLGNGGITPVGDPWGLALGPGGAFGDGIYVMDFQGASPNPPLIFRIFGPSSSNAFPLVNGAVWTTERVPTEISFGPPSFGGDLYVLDPVTTPGTPPTIWRIGSTGLVSVFLTLSGQVPTAMKFAPGGAFGTNLYVLMESGVLVEIAPDGTMSTVAQGIPVDPGVSDMAFAPGGGRLFVAANNAIFEVVPSVPPIPALSDWAIVVLLVLLAAVASGSLRRLRNG